LKRQNKTRPTKSILLKKAICEIGVGDVVKQYFVVVFDTSIIQDTANVVKQNLKREGGRISEKVL